jgi:hypothetical protein
MLVFNLVYLKRLANHLYLRTYETKELKLQVIPQGQATPIVPSDEIPIDDDLSSNYTPDDFANNGVVDKSPTSFAYGANVKKPVDTKSLEMFCMACVKVSS